MQRDTVPLFATPVFVTKQPDAEWHNKEWLDKALSLQYRKNKGNWASVETNVLDLPDWKLLKDVVQTELDLILKDFYKLDLSNIKLVVTQSWLNVNNDSEYHPMHTHTNSMLSGIIYLNTSEEDAIRFTDNKFNTRMSFVSIPNMVLPVKKGDIILFDSQLPHSVDAAKRKEKRVSLAFNTFVVGELGSEDGLSFVNIENVRGVTNG
tara:strand:- start:40576 stop:41196 length:621 start_codon:yes stop_codon:yes gene_type:complete